VHLSSQARQKAEIWRITIPGQSGGKKFARPHLKRTKEVVVHAYYFSYQGKPEQNAKPVSKITRAKKG
jgi:hypothetical protein